MRTAFALTLAVLVAIPVAGCLEGGEQLDSTTTSTPPSEGNASEPGNVSTETPETKNASRGEDRSQDPETVTNKTDDSGEPNETEPSEPRREALPTRVTVEDANLVSRNRTSATYRWNATVETTAAGLEPTDGHGVERTTVLVPRELRAEVAPTLTWETEADLDLSLVDGEGREMCSSTTGGPTGEEACAIVSTSPPIDEEWRIVVDSRQRSDGSADPIEFEVDVTVRTVEEPDRSGEGDPIDPGWPALEDAIVRPGSKLFEPLKLEPLGPKGGRTCTANFLFSTPDNRTLYIGTASHCVGHLRVGDEIGVAHGRVTGTVVYCSFGAIAHTTQCLNTPQASLEGSEWNDFALIRIPDDARDLVHPAVEFWGGPPGFAPSDHERGDLALTYGNSDLRDADQDDASGPLDPREGVVWASEDPTTYVKFAGDVVSGDSGSPALDRQGRAMGVVVNLSASDTGAVPDPLVTGVPHLEPMVAWMEANTDLEVELKTWRTLEQPRLSSVPSP